MIGDFALSSKLPVRDRFPSSSSIYIYMVVVVVGGVDKVSNLGD
ncbi:MAG: hypothetical protein ACI9UK_000621 [Candidatus Krumholzibacteriia bacterium]|jgi:hypothetical protein